MTEPTWHPLECGCCFNALAAGSIVQTMQAKEGDFVATVQLKPLRGFATMEEAQRTAVHIARTIHLALAQTGDAQ